MDAKTKEVMEGILTVLKGGETVELANGKTGILYYFGDDQIESIENLLYFDSFDFFYFVWDNHPLEEIPKSLDAIPKDILEEAKPAFRKYLKRWGM